MICAFEEKIDRRLLGDLAPGELDSLRSHIAGCPGCAARLEEAGYLETLLVGAFRDVESRLRSPREAVLRAIAAGGAASRRARPASVLAGRRFGVFVLVNAVAAALILSASLGYLYLSLLRAERRALTAQARDEVRNVGIVLRAQEARTPAEAAGALRALGLERDAFGNPFVIAAAGSASSVYSRGGNGRDDGGAGDDIVAWGR